jgi:hypothetical protein
MRHNSNFFRDAVMVAREVIASLSFSIAPTETESAPARAHGNRPFGKIFHAVSSQFQILSLVNSNSICFITV